MVDKQSPRTTRARVAPFFLIVHETGWCRYMNTLSRRNSTIVWGTLGVHAVCRPTCTLDVLVCDVGDTDPRWERWRTNVSGIAACSGEVIGFHGDSLFKVRNRAASDRSLIFGDAVTGIVPGAEGLTYVTSRLNVRQVSVPLMETLWCARITWLRVLMECGSRVRRVCHTSTIATRAPDIRFGEWSSVGTTGHSSLERGGRREQARF